MEKLIELLNEYDKEDEWSETKWTEKHFWWLLELQIISKKFWFIQWLVENDKIDMITLWKVWMYWDLEQCWISPYNALLMLLSISDTPIEDLLLYLK